MSSCGPAPISERFRDAMSQRLPMVRCHHASSLTCAINFWSATSAKNLGTLSAPNSGREVLAFAVFEAPPPASGG